MKPRSAVRLWISLVMLALLACASAPALSTSVVAPFDLSTFIAELEHWSTAISGLQEHPDQWALLRRSLPTSWTVEAEDQRFDVSTRALSDALSMYGAKPNQRVALRGQMMGLLTTLHDEAIAFSQRPRASTRDAASRVQEILGRREFRPPGEPAIWNRL